MSIKQSCAMIKSYYEGRGYKVKAVSYDNNKYTITFFKSSPGPMGAHSLALSALGVKHIMKHYRKD